MTVAVKMQREKNEYRKLRDELLVAEIALKDKRERVAVLRRAAPLSRWSFSAISASSS